MTILRSQRYTLVIIVHFEIQEKKIQNLHHLVEQISKHDKKHNLHDYSNIHTRLRTKW